MSFLVPYVETELSIAGTDEHFAIGRAIAGIESALSSNNRDVILKAITAAETVLDRVNLAALGAHLAASQIPATSDEIAEHLALTIGAFPNAKPANPEVFGRMLVEEVKASRPSIGALEAACRLVRRTQRFCPAIAEVIRTLELVENDLRDRVDTVQRLPSLVQTAHQAVARLEEQERALAEHRQRLLEEEEEVIRSRILRGKNLMMFNLGRVVDVRRKMEAAGELGDGW